MRFILLFMTLALALAACADITAADADKERHYGEVKIPSAKVTVSRYQPIAEGVAAEHAGVPAAYIPPPGFCRIWYPERPASTQPDTSSCDVQVPPGAVLVRR